MHEEDGEANARLIAAAPWELVRSLQAIQRRTKVCKAVFRRVSQHTQGAQDGEAMISSLATGITVVNEECVGGLFQRQGNGGRQPRRVRDRNAVQRRAPAGAWTISHSGRSESR